MQPIVDLAGAAFRRESRLIFENLDLQLGQGEIVCLLGPNGCGKTTLLQCIAGLLSLERGVVRLAGDDTTHLTARQIAQRIGFVFQDHQGLFPYRVRDVVSMGRTPHLGWLARPGLADQRICADALARIGMSHVADIPYTQLSGGERQLVQIARAIAQETSVLLLDEPTAHLDFGNQVLVLATMRRLAAEGLAMLVATHSPDQALAVGSRIAMMRDGGLVAVGPADRVMTEENLRRLYGVQVRIIAVPDAGDGVAKTVVPVLERQSLDTVRERPIDSQSRLGPEYGNP
jgi:iron complex transport system ATP-binding protein